jgi:actin-related protein
LIQTIESEQKIEDAVARTVSARRAGQFDQCLEVLKSALAAHPSAERLLTLDREIRDQVYTESLALAREQLSRQRFDQAIGAAETALTIRPKDPAAIGLIDSIRTEKEIEAAIERAQVARRSGQIGKALEIVTSVPRSAASEARLKQIAEEISQEIAREKEIQQREQARRRAEEDARKRAEEERRRQVEEDARRQEEEAKARKRAAEEEAKRRADEEKARRKIEEERARKQAEEEQARRKAEQEAQRRAAEEARARKKAEEDQSRTRAAAASSTSILKTGSTTPVDTQGSAPTPTLAAEPKAVPTPPQAYRLAPEPAPRPSKSQTPVIAAAAAAVLLLIAAGVWFMNRETTPAAEPEKTAAITPETTAPARPVTPEPAARVAPPQPQTTQPQTQQPATPAPAPQLQVLQSKLTFSWQRGTTAPPPQSFAISGSKQAFLATASSRWIAVSPNRATAPRNVTVSVNPGDLQPGTHSDIIRIVPTDNSFSTQTVAVEFVVTAEARQPEVAKQTPPAPTPIPQQTPQQTTQQTLPSQPAAQQAPAASSPSPAAQGKWLGATRGSITYSGDIPAGGRIVISTSKVIDGPSGDVDFSRTPPPFDAVRIEKTSAGVTAVPRGYDLVITNTSGAPIRLVQIEWSYQPKR